MVPRSSVLAALAALALLGCERRADVGPVIVSAIGEPPALADASRGAAALPDRLLTDAVAQGLVRFNAAGQIEPGIAERWIVTDEGTTYIFRLRDLRWSDGRPLRASEVVAILRRHVARGSGNPLLPYLSAIDSIVEMTPQVIEVSLSRPRPDLLNLFAQPELAIVRLQPDRGTGPLRIAARGTRSLRLSPVVDQTAPDDEDAYRPTAEDDVRLIGERAARAVARFVARRSDLVAGGTIADWPLVAASGAAPVNIRLDPAAGLFGLAVVERSGFLESVEGRAAVALAIDRPALVAAIASDWAPTEQILPGQLDSAAPPATGGWAATRATERKQAAAAIVARWRGDGNPRPVLRLALPPGPGGTILWGRIAADLRDAGIGARRVAEGEPADLRLVDLVAPYDSARWYLLNACVGCAAPAAELIEAARTAPTLVDRASALAQADQALTDDVAFIPIARPLRWSLVSLRLRQWQPNTRAWHPLNRLRPDPN